MSGHHKWKDIKMNKDIQVEKSSYTLALENALKWVASLPDDQLRHLYVACEEYNGNTLYGIVEGIRLARECRTDEQEKLRSAINAQS